MRSKHASRRAYELLEAPRPFQPMVTDHPNQIVLRPPSSLQVNPRNARLHSKKQDRQIANSITAAGFIGAIIVDEKGMVLAGHGRLEAATLLEMNLVPTLQVTGLSETQKRAFALADNKI